MNGLESYRDVSAYACVVEASPYELVKLMFDGLLTRVNEARGHIQRQEIAAKSDRIGRALGIVEGLHMSLDKERGGEIAANLEQLYEYISRLLLRANIDNDAAALDEVASLVREVKAGWDAIGSTPA
jgi:flagellar protein FliS